MKRTRCSCGRSAQLEDVAEHQRPERKISKGINNSTPVVCISICHAAVAPHLPRVSPFSCPCTNTKDKDDLSHTLDQTTKVHQRAAHLLIDRASSIKHQSAGLDSGKGTAMPPITITYTLHPSQPLPPALTQALASIRTHLPLRNLHWKPSSRTSIRTIQEVDVNLIELGDVGPSTAGRLGGSVMETPLVNLCLVVCEVSRLGTWVLDLVWYGTLATGMTVLNTGYWILNTQYSILNTAYCGWAQGILD